MNITIGTQEFPWSQFYAYRGQRLQDHLDEALASAAAAGLGAWEPFVFPDERSAASFAALLAKHRLAMPSVYANARLHEPEWRRVADDVVRMAGIARTVGATVLALNPEPIQWGQPIDKPDDALRRQAEAMRYLTTALRQVGVELAYHVHDPEMRNAARELHHTLLATRDVRMGLCLDDHWIYRGAGNSNVALQDALTLYGDRIVSLHLRQSRGGVWTETLCTGDVDFAPIVAQLRAMNFAGPVIIEQAYETGTPRALSMTESLKQSRKWVRQMFNELGPRMNADEENE